MAAPPDLTAQWIETIAGKMRVASVGRRKMDRTEWGSWDGWELLYARDVPDGFYVRMHGYEFPVKREPFDRKDHWTFRRDDDAGRHSVPFMIWGGCLVWTYTGRS